jgi:hypothetical protein
MGRRRDPHRCEPIDLETTRDLVEEVLRTALALEDVMVSLLEDLPDGAFPGEDNGLVLLEMVVGSVHPAAVAAGPREVRAATALVGAVRERVLADLRTAAAIARERERGNASETSEKS